MRALRTLVLLLLTACDAQVWDFDAGARSANGGRDTASESDAATAACEADVCVCAAEQLQCGSTCVDPTSSTLHCGGCDKACGEGERCRESQCECAAQQTRCGPICANILTNALHCGACNQQCPSNQVCLGGR